MGVMSFLESILFGFMSPQQRKEQREREARWARESLARAQAAGQVRQWDEDKTTFQKLLFIDGASWKPHTLFDVQPGNGRDEHTMKKDTLVYYHKVLPAATWLEIYAGGGRRGHVMFSTDVVIPALTDPTALVREEDNVWMSYTPMEVFTCRPGVRRAKGRVVVGGLGLGWMLKKISAKPTVTEVVLVEQNQVQLDWYGNEMVDKLRAQFPRKKFTVICDDVYAAAKTLGNEYHYSLDIFPGYGRASWDRDVRDLRKAGADVWAWGENAYKSEGRW